MTVPPIVFVGPSLRRPLPPDFDVRPPAAAGDLLALAGRAPTVVVLIDGVFDAQASVQHKEILELVSRGFRVLGGASMGALRAAELHSHGMYGVGAVFAAYAAGRLTADDEVALLHAPAELDFRPLTEALIDMRATLAAAAGARVVSISAARMIRDHARRRFWRERTWDTVLDDCRVVIDRSTLADFEAWLPSGRVSVKECDARLCLRAALCAGEHVTIPPPPRTSFFTALASSRGITLQPNTESSPER